MDTIKIYQVASEADACVVAGPKLAIVAVSRAIMAQNAPKALKDLLAFDNAETFPAAEISSMRCQYDLETTLIVCAVLHNRHDIVPRVLKLAQFEKVVSLGKLWQCEFALQFRAEIWMSAIGNQTVNPNTLASLLKLSIDLDSETSLKEAYRHLVLDLPFNTDFSTLSNLTLGVRALLGIVSSLSITCVNIPAEACSLRNFALTNFMIAVCSVYDEFEPRRKGTGCYKISKCSGIMYPVETDPIQNLKPYNLFPNMTLLQHSPASLIKVTEKLPVDRPAMAFSDCECRKCGRTYQWRCNPPFNTSSPYELIAKALKATRRAIPKIPIAELKHEAEAAALEHEAEAAALKHEAEAAALKHEAEAAALKHADTVKFKQEPTVVKLKHDAETPEAKHEEQVADVKHDTATPDQKHEAKMSEAKAEVKHNAHSHELHQDAQMSEANPEFKHTAGSSELKQEADVPDMKVNADMPGAKHETKMNEIKHDAEIMETGGDAGKENPVKREEKTEFLDATEKTTQHEMEMQRAEREMSEDEVSIVSATEAQSPARSS